MQEDAPGWVTTSSTGDGAIPGQEPLVADAPLDAFEASVFGELEKLRNPTGNWVQALVILAISLVAFVGLGMQNNPVAFTVTLVGVLLFHELGHYVGMRIFGYRNVRMFFIPFFGAAVSGQRTDARSYQEAIVTLLGPLPGLCVAFALFGVAFVPGIDREHRLLLVQTAILFGMINAFNLLPIFPLDGGRLLNQVLFSRNRYWESVFQVLAATALVAYGATQDRKFLLFIGVGLLTTVGTTFKTNTIAQRIGKHFGDQLPPMNGPIPPVIFLVMVDQVKYYLPKVKDAKGMAGVVFRVWEKMHVQPPGWIATLALLLVYLLAAILTVPWLLPLFLHTPRR